MEEIKNKIYTVTIGIPAYNEEANISYLLDSLLSQKEEGFVIERILVVSDGSSDRTTEIVRGFKDKKVSIIDNKKRNGVAFGQNQIIQNCNSDILVLLNADIKIENPLFLSFLVLPIIKNGADLVSGNLSALKPESFMEKILAAGMLLKDFMFESYKSGRNIYTCYGPARAFSRKLYKKMSFPGSIGEDAYSYLFCRSRGFFYAHVALAVAFVKMPGNFSDHFKQSIRFIQSKRKFIKIFGEKFVVEEYKLPLGLVVKSIIYSFIRLPLYTFCYLAVNSLVKLKSKNYPAIPERWEISSSSKIEDSANTVAEPVEPKESFSVSTAVRRIVYYFLFIIDKLVLNRKSPVVIFCYHSISSDWYHGVSFENFKKQIDYLASEYDPICIDGLRQIITGIKKMEKPAFLITFDDGYKDILAVKAYLAGKNIKPALFMLSDRENINREQLETDKELLSVSEILELKKAGWEIGCHGATHSDFEKLGNEELKKEIIGAKIQLEKELRFGIEYFTYPKGKYSKEILDMVRRQNYKMAFSMDDSLISSKTNIFAVPRIGINQSHSFLEFKALFLPSAIFFRGLVKKILQLRKDSKKSIRQNNYSDIAA